MRVLVVEDHAMMADAIATGLRREGAAVDVAGDGATALDRALVTDYDVIVLDRDLPVLHGDEVCRRLSDRDPAPKILMLTAASSVESTIDGLDLGADDYLTKPFAFGELSARLRALSRRPATMLPTTFSFQDLVLDPVRRAARRGARDLFLTAREVALLEVLLAPPGRVVSTEELLERVWDENADPFTTAVKVAISRLRRKLGDPPLITTVPNAGYRLDAG
jgi:DNA-binding response OmpR family regulator